MQRALEETLLENAEDFLREAVRYARASTGRDWKYAVVHLCVALELILKAILAKEHWSLVFENVNEASKEKLTTGGFRSARFETALERAQRIVGMQIGPKDLRYLRALHEIRNRLIHFADTVNIDQVKALVARGLSVFFDLRKDYLGAERGLEYEINQALRDFGKYVTERMRSLSQELERAERPQRWFRSCPACAQDALAIAPSELRIRCLFCGGEYTFAELAEHSDGAGGPCPQCAIGALGFVLFNNDDGQFVCVYCGFRCDHNYNMRCSICGETFWSADGSLVCPDCWEQQVGSA